MSVTDKLLGSITQTKAREPLIQELARETLHHAHPCGCAACKAFDSLAGNRDAKVAPTAVTQALVESVVGSKQLKRGDEDGHGVSGPKKGDGRPKRKLPIDAKLAGSMDAILGHKR